MNHNYNAYQAASLVWTLLERELKGQYRRSILGLTWLILQPVIYLAIFSFLRGILDIPSDGTPYVVFLYCGLAPWLFFANAVSRIGRCIRTNGPIVAKTHISRLVFPVVALGQGLVDFAIAAVILATLMAWFQVPVGWTVLWVPVLVALLGLFALGLGLVIAAVGTSRDDVNLALPYLLMVWMLASPIIYPVSVVPASFQPLFAINPMFGIVEGFRSVLLFGASPDLSSLGVSVLGTIIAWAFGWPLFNRNAKFFSDIM